MVDTPYMTHTHTQRYAGYHNSVSVGWGEQRSSGPPGDSVKLLDSKLTFVYEVKLHSAFCESNDVHLRWFNDDTNKFHKCLQTCANSDHVWRKSLQSTEYASSTNYTPACTRSCTWLMDQYPTWDPKVFFCFGLSIIELQFTRLMQYIQIPHVFYSLLFQCENELVCSLLWTYSVMETLPTDVSTITCYSLSLFVGLADLLVSTLPYLHVFIHIPQRKASAHLWMKTTTCLLTNKLNLLFKLTNVLFDSAHRSLLALKVQLSFTKQTVVIEQTVITEWKQFNARQEVGQTCSSVSCTAFCCLQQKSQCCIRISWSKNVQTNDNK